MKPRLILLFCAAALAGSPNHVPIRGFAADELKAEREREAAAKAIPQSANIKALAKWLTSQPHPAGSPRSKAVAHHIARLLREWGLETSIETFNPLLPYPTVRRLELVTPTRFVAGLREPPVARDRDTQAPGQTPAYNAYSASGDVTAPLMYVNFGLPEDYEELSRRGLDVRGKIVIARYGRSWRGVKPRLAQDHGAVGCILYSDPHEDGFFAGDVYPDGPFRPLLGVQRGSVLDVAIHPGDPLTPGWASESGARRLPLSEARTIMRIPVLPISAGDAEPLLSALAGPVAPAEWRGALPLTYHIGPGAATVRLNTAFDWTSRPIYNVIGRIPGAVFPDQWVVWGNHHDAWGPGANDPVSGLAPVLEAARAAAELARRGWKPKRTILFTFWDGEEFGLIGSTEWVEKHRAELDRKLAFYFNSDSNSRGSLRGSGSPALESFVNEIARDIADPVSGKSLADAARPASARKGSRESVPIRLGPIGAGSDYVPFLNHLGVSSLNLSFYGDDDATGVYHSAYDTFGWYRRFCDGEYAYGRALAQVVLLALMRTADASVLPYEFGALAGAIRGYANDLARQTSNRFWRSLDLREIYAQVGRLDGNAHNFDDALGASKKLFQAPAAKLAKLNTALYRTERALLAPKGLPGREWYRNQLYAPGVYTGYTAKTLPGVREAAEASRWEEANREAGNVAQALKALNAQLEEAVRLLRELED
ncbi:MAG: M20/M25/M40 family metallo-hydrolase [Acidobacteria bacterium]|nr:M20/M25/M40 family metallo-hydrolase [Acidobacteriota bacterium]